MLLGRIQCSLETLKIPRFDFRKNIFTTIVIIHVAVPFNFETVGGGKAGCNNYFRMGPISS